MQNEPIPAIRDWFILFIRKYYGSFQAAKNNSLRSPEASGLGKKPSRILDFQSISNRSIYFY